MLSIAFALNGTTITSSMKSGRVGRIFAKRCPPTGGFVAVPRWICRIPSDPASPVPLSGALYNIS